MRLRSPLLVCAALAFLTACGVGRPAATDGSDASASPGDGCTQCHGSGTDPAPPRSAHGETATTSLAVGAHQAHLHDGALRRAVACAECHVVPTSLAHADGEARVTFGPTANAGGVASAWDRATATCATYCHGASLAGGAHANPVWTAGAGEAACGSCHGMPPPAPHPATTADCGGCHAGYTRATVNLDLHVDGNVQVAGSGGAGGVGCTSCHGDAARASNPAAPPRDTGGNTATTARGVGAHQAHLSATLAAPVACAACHLVPTSTSHSNGTVDLAFSGRAAGTTWNGANVTCTTACHGSTLNAGGTATTPTWTRVDGTQKTCTSCHGNSPSTGEHQRSAHLSRSCADCHGTGYGSGAVNATLHVNGTKDVGGTGSRINSWNASTRSCAPACHGTETW